MSTDDFYAKPTILGEFASLSGFVSDKILFRLPPPGSQEGFEFHRYVPREQAQLERRFGFEPDEAYQQYSTNICNLDGCLEYKTATDIERDRAAVKNPPKKEEDFKAKKKISLADYKKKKVNPSKQSPEPTVEINSRPSTSSSAGPSTGPSFAEANSQPTREVPVELSIKEDSPQKTAAPKTPVEETTFRETMAAKQPPKARPAPARPAGKSTKLPRMLSPLLDSPPKPALPRMLSPTLPSWVSKLIEQHEHAKSPPLAVAPSTLLVKLKYPHSLAKRINTILQRPKKRPASFSSGEESEVDAWTPSKPSKKPKTLPPATVSPQPATPSLPNGATRPSSSSTKEITARLREMAMKHNSLGRELKHAMAKHNSDSESGRCLTAVTFLDSVMSYMLAYSYEDERLHRLKSPPNYLNSWATLIPYAAGKHTGDLEVLEAMQNYLLYAIHTHTIDLMLKSAAISANPDDPAVARPGQSKSKFDAYLPTLYENANKHLMRAHKVLHLDEMRYKIPTTWSSRIKITSDSRIRGRREDLLINNGGKRGGYSLPIDSLTSPVEAVRLAAAVIREVVAKKGVEYDPKSMATLV
jgi:hypothetical protein